MLPIYQQMATNLVPKSSTIFVCKKCDYITYRKSQYDRHVLTAKHLMATDGNKKVPISQHFFNCIVIFKLSNNS
jgi:hypothetical protein